jgi:hypothetical protein
VENVFHSVPQPSNGGSGVPSAKQHQTLDLVGRQLHSGHRIRSNALSSSGPETMNVCTSLCGSAFFSSCMTRSTHHSNTAAVQKKSGGS